MKVGEILLLGTKVGDRHIYASLKYVFTDTRMLIPRLIQTMARFSKHSFVWHKTHPITKHITFKPVQRNSNNIF